MFNVRMVPVSGSGVRPSLFNGSVEQSRSFHPSLAGGSWMGATSPAEWYAKAKAALAQFDSSLSRTGGIANMTERNRILAWVGKADNHDSPAYRYASVLSDLTDVEAVTPIHVNDYQLPRRQNRIDELSDFNAEFSNMVTSAENLYGKLPEPVVINRETIVNTGAGTNWTLPLIVGGGAVAVAVVVSLLAGK